MPAPPGMGRQRQQPLRRTGDGMGTPVDTIRNTSSIPPYTLPLAGIYCYNGCMSPTWWYATTHLPSEAANYDGSPLHNDRMASRSFIFRNFYRGPSKILWPEKLRYTNKHRERTLLSATTSDLLLRLKVRLWRDYVFRFFFKNIFWNSFRKFENIFFVWPGMVV